MGKHSILVNTVHYIIIPPQYLDGSEPIKYLCKEWPCVDKELQVYSENLDAHARYHGAYALAVDI